MLQEKIVFKTIENIWKPWWIEILAMERTSHFTSLVMRRSRSIECILDIFDFYYF